MIRLVVFLLLTLIGLPAMAAEMTKLRIAVTNQDGKPVDRASVVVKFIEGRSYLKLGKKQRNSYELRTNQDGVAKLPEIPQGKILIQMIAKEYQTFGQTFDVGEEERTIEVKLKPPQSQYSAH